MAITSPADIKWLGAGTVTVTRQGVTITPKAVDDIIRNYIAAQAGVLPDAIYTFSPKDPPLPFMVPTWDLQWEVTPSNPGIIGSSRFALIGRIDDQVVKNLVALSIGDLSKSPPDLLLCVKAVVVISPSKLGDIKGSVLAPLAHICSHVHRSHDPFDFACRFSIQSVFNGCKHILLSVFKV
ncbi:MAG: hypothetical protein K0A99_10255 [Desulfoarculaceae bacterium]|nr:hypothetical protein [Desulfoarculaceae bacterium]